MTLGLVTSFIITFTLLPTLLNFAPTKDMDINKNEGSTITGFLGNLSLNYQISIFIITFVIMIMSVFGISKLEVEIVSLIILVKKLKYIKE